ncbi:cytoskeletal protein RodZ [Sphingomonas naasensis]|uniref:calcium-binding protein n=1 Tax=Sphingomonas naasensis TaxID=1344951 RepID=UPI0019CF8B65|nr:calcium-binding protein [Sphingomonas naasensis]NIJ19655.1 cytoskeletal protein RodZ [Sphingomonas naasensis]
MLKAVLLTTSILVAAPVFAQDKPATETKQEQKVAPKDKAAKPATPATTDDAAPGTQGSGTVEEAPAATPAPATEAAQPTPTQPAQPATQPAPAQPPQPTQPTPEAAPSGTSGAGTAGTAAAQPAAQPAATQDQVAQAVSRDFGTYDKDANGMLSDAEFGTWMSALRKASEPSFVPGSADANVWLGQAFAAADADKSKAINQAELTTFLTPKAS